MLRFGILSTANISKKVADAILKSKKGKIVAVASRNLQKASDWIATLKLDPSQVPFFFFFFFSSSLLLLLILFFLSFLLP